MPIVSLILSLSGASLAAEAPAPVVEEEVSKREPRFQGVVGLGGSYVDVLGGTSRSRPGLDLDLRAGLGLGKRAQIDLLTSFGVAYPERTVAIGRAAIAHGEWTVQAFYDVTAWAESNGEDDDLQGLRVMGAMFAYMGLTLSFLGVPLLLVVSPVASIDHATMGPVLRVYASEAAPDLYFEVGFAGLGYATLDRWGVGWGPVFGLGAQLRERLAVGMHMTVSPPGLRDDVSGAGGTVVSSAMVAYF